MKIANIPLDFLNTDNNIREVGDTTELEKSMDVAGQAVEIRVSLSHEDGTYNVISGHRRIQAAKNLGWTSIRAVIIESYEDELQQIIDQYNENSQREDMDYNTRAKLLSRVVKMSGLSQAQLALNFGMSQSEVSLSLALSKAHPKLQKAVAEERISPSAVEPLLALSEEEQEELIDAAIKEKTVRRVRALVSAHKKRMNIVGTITQIKDNGVDPFDKLVLEELEKVDQHLDNILPSEISDKDLVVKTLDKVAYKITNLLEQLGV